MMTVFAIDPGPQQSAYIRWDGTLLAAEIVPNRTLLSFVRMALFDKIAIEMVACYGMAVGKEVFETCLWIGRFSQHSDEWRGIEPDLIPRLTIKLHHCKTAKAKDTNIRQALIDKYGKPGTKGNQGRLYGVKSHLWAALALATYISEISTTAHVAKVEAAPVHGEIAGVPPACAVAG